MSPAKFFYGGECPSLIDLALRNRYQEYNTWPPIRTTLLFTNGEKVMFKFWRYPLCGFRATKRNPELPVLTKAQIEALDAVHSFAAKNLMALTTETGGIVYLNSMSILHAREPLESQVSKNTKSQKHVLKLQLRNPQRA